jgi:diguanylate cyclase (GGDEF)-like protein/PAS domain S-box-containing protein
MAKRIRDAEMALNILEGSPSIALRVSKAGGAWRTQFVTGNVRAYGYSPEELTGGEVVWADIIHPGDVAPLEKEVEAYANNGQDHYTVLYRIMAKNGEYIWVSDSRTVARGGGGEILYIDSMVHNCTMLMSAARLCGQNKAAARKMAANDQLTGLANRYGFESRLEKAIQSAKAAGESGCVLLIDMDDFKVINDGYGHGYGDALLVSVAAYLETFFSGRAGLFRSGGDEFIILVSHENAGLVQETVNALLNRAPSSLALLAGPQRCQARFKVICISRSQKV